VGRDGHGDHADSPSGGVMDITGGALVLNGYQV